ncbi:MAG: tetratricopeptide repeat protein [Anaerolineae bacterium]|nr:tetratricopeptide repeat protein [Anaerolineae bacterium]
MPRRWFRCQFIIACFPLLLLAVAPALAQPATPPPTPTPFIGLAADVFQRARGELEAGDYSTALLDFSLYLALNPASSQAYFGQALSLLSLERPEDALQSIEHAIQTAPDHAGFRAALLTAQAQIQLALDQPEAAIASLNAAVELEPTALNYASRARLLAGQEDYAAAIADLDTAIELTPDDPALYLQRALLHNRVQDPTAAGADYFQYINAIGVNIGRNDPLTPEVAAFSTLEEGLVLVFPFEGRAGQTATIAAIARPGDPVDPLIVLIGPSGQPLAGDDDGGGNFDSLLRDVPLPSDGTYTVLLTHAMGGSAGQVAIAVQLSGMPERTPAEPAPGGKPGR